METQSFLDYIAKYVDLNTSEKEFLLERIQVRNYLKGQYVLQQGDICKHECFILSGCTKMFHLDKDGHEHVIMFSIEDWWTSDMGSFITQTPSDFSVQCIENTKMVQISHDVAEDLFLEIPKLERFFRKIVEKALVASQKRIVRNFSMTAKERYLFFSQTYPEMEQRIPQYQIASYLGITKEFLSKIKREIATSDHDVKLD